MLKQKKHAEYVMNFLSPYDTHSADYSPHMHQEFKKNVEMMTKNRVFVEVFDGARMGAGTEIMSQVVYKTVEAGLLSASNLTPIAPELDLLNIPFWSAKDQQYLNLVTSSRWRKQVIDAIEAQGRITVLFHYLVGSRTISTIKSSPELIITPEQLKQKVFRVPASKVLRQFYQMAYARTRSVPWGKTAAAARKLLFDGLDPGIIGLYNGPDNLKEEIATVCNLETVHDGWVAVVNQQWLYSLPKKLRFAVIEAAQVTFEQQLMSCIKTRGRCAQYFRDKGVVFYTPTEVEREEWVQRFGHHQKFWEPFKKSLLGDASHFKYLLDATQKNNGYTIANSGSEQV